LIESECLVFLTPGEQCASYISWQHNNARRAMCQLYIMVEE